MGIHYGDYLKLDQLLSAQEPLSRLDGEPAHDELLFIIVHQAYELWFKQVLFELETVHALFDKERVLATEMERAVAHLRRVAEIQKLFVQHLTVLETMTPLDFMDFRDELFPASGAQSVQFRRVENLLGLRKPKRLDINGMPYTDPLDADEKAAVAASEQRASLLDLVQGWLERTPFLTAEGFDFVGEYSAIVNELFAQDEERIRTDERVTEEERIDRLADHAKKVARFERLFRRVDGPDVEPVLEGDGPHLSARALQAALMIDVYREEPHLQLPFRFLTLLMDVDAGFTTWRYRHAQMVTRMIGTRVGTGGTTGASYLKHAAESHSVFNDLFQLSTFLIPRSRVPKLPAAVRQKLGFEHED